MNTLNNMKSLEQGIHFGSACEADSNTRRSRFGASHTHYWMPPFTLRLHALHTAAAVSTLSDLTLP